MELAKMSCYVVFGDFIAFNKEAMLIYRATHKKIYIYSLPEALRKKYGCWVPYPW